ncbi:MAG: DUF6541 family protein [Anaerolineae bacterium]
MIRSLFEYCKEPVSGLILLFLLSLFAIWPLLAPGLPHTADGPVHFYRAVDFDRSWRDGILYPRWAPDLALGYGTPLFNFAPPLLYLLTQAFHLAGLDISVAMKAVIILTVFLYPLGMCIFVRERFGFRAGFVAAAAYFYAPYRLRELYIQGNYAQFLALALYPFILWAFHRLVGEWGVENGGWGKVGYMALAAISYAALLLSHNISAMLFTPLLAFYVLFLAAWRRKFRSLLWAGGAIAWSLALAGFFWIPAFFERRWIRLGEITKGHFDFRLHFLSPAELFALPAPLDLASLNPYLPLGLGWAVVVLSVLALLALLRWPVKERPLAFFFALALAFCLFMTLPISIPFWENVPLLALVEFPWRFLGPALLAGAFLAGAFSSQVQRTSLLIGVVFFILLSSFFYLYPRQPFADLRGSTPADIIAYELETKTFGTTGASEFHPIWSEEPPLDSPMVADYQAGRPPDKLDRSSLPLGASAETLSHTAIADEFIFSSPHPFSARVNTLYFPGWRAYLDGQPVEVKIAPPHGLIEVEIPPGEHRLSLRFEDTPLRLWANLISLLAWVALLAVAICSSVGKFWRAPWPAKSSSTLKRLELGLALIGLLIFKEAFIDPHTTWFRKHSPPDRVLGVSYPAYVEMAKGRFVFLGYDLSPADGLVRQGGTLDLTLYWKLEVGSWKLEDGDFRSFVHMDLPPDFTTVAVSDNMNPGGVPTSRWPPGLYVRDLHRLQVPQDAPPVEYTLHAGLYDGQTGMRLPVEGGGNLIPLTSIHVLRAEPLRPEALPHSQERFTLGGNISLLGYALEPAGIRPGGSFTLTLYWRAEETLKESYTVFAHVLDEAGHLRAQADGLPAGDIYPTSSWLPGQVVEDSRRITLPKDVPPGAYRLEVGMYRLDTLARLEVRDGAGNAQPEGRAILEERLTVQ